MSRKAGVLFAALFASALGLLLLSPPPGAADQVHPEAKSIALKVQGPDKTPFGKLHLARLDGKPLAFMEKAQDHPKKFQAIPDLGDPLAWGFHFEPKSRDYLPALKMQQQFETSMSISDEGPHLDLTNWKHGVSPWQDLSEEANLTFRSKPLLMADAAFPEYKTEELVKAVKAEVARWQTEADEKSARWIELAKNCGKKDDYACMEAISQVRFRLLAQIDGEWTELYRVVFDVPMGC